MMETAESIRKSAPAVGGDGDDGAPAGPAKAAGTRGWLPRPAHVGFLLAGYASACFPMILGRLLWPTGLAAGTENLFWPATAVNIAGMARLGLGTWPAVVLGALLGQLTLGLPLGTSVINAFGNLAEALVVVLALRFAGVAERPLHSVRGAWVFIGAALLAPLCSSVPGAATLLAQDRLAADDYWAAVGVWSFANSASIVLLAPLLLTVGRGAAFWRRRSREILLWLLTGVVAGWWAFQAVFAAGGGVNYAFLVFPFVIYAAVRLGVAETAFALFCVMALMYGVLIARAGAMDAASVNSTLWFLQVYGFVLGASGLLLAALTSDREAAELRLREERTRSLEAALREERARLDVLRYQINPHFLFNSLNSVCAVANEPAREMVAALAGYLRSTLTSVDIERVRLCDEFTGVERYLAIERIRHGDALRVEMELDPALREHPVPPFLLQPLVENALRHGFEQSKGVFHLKIGAKVTEAGIELRVENTGRWREGPSKGTGLGMDNVRRRLGLVYGEEAALRVETDTPGWVRVRLILPKGGAA